VTNGAVMNGAVMNGAAMNGVVMDDVQAALPSAPASSAQEESVQERSLQENSAAPALTRGGLIRRQPGGHLPAFDMNQSPADQSTAPERPPSTRGGLSRRVPGTHLDRSLRVSHASPQLATQSTQTRDPRAERAELDSFVAGVARAMGGPSDAPANQ
jgi:hypothetical protein